MSSQNPARPNFSRFRLGKLRVAADRIVNIIRASLKRGLPASQTRERKPTQQSSSRAREHTGNGADGQAAKGCQANRVAPEISMEALCRADSDLCGGLIRNAALWAQAVQSAWRKGCCLPLTGRSDPLPSRLARLDTIRADGSRWCEDGTLGETGQTGKARRIFRDPRETPPRAGASVDILRDSLKPGGSRDLTRVKIVSVSGHLAPGGR
jgi:hypothetical protein